MQNKNKMTSEPFSQLASEVDNSKLWAEGKYSKLAAAGEDSELSAEGQCSNLAAAGECSRLAAAGEYSSLAAAAGDSALIAQGRYSVAISCGRGSRVKGAEGTLIALTHYCRGCEFIPLKIVTGRIGEEGLLPDTWYTLNLKGEFVEYRQFIENYSIAISCGNGGIVKANALSKKIKKFFINFIQ